MSWGEEEVRSAPAPRYEERVVVAAFTFPWEAELARALLASEGIHAVLADENLVRLYWFVANAVGGVKILVAESEADRAAEVLRRPADLPEIGLASDADIPAAPACPRCRSANLAFERWSRGGFVATLLLFKFPIPIPRPRWRCSRCKSVWRPEELDLDE